MGRSVWRGKRTDAELNVEAFGENRYLLLPAKISFSEIRVRILPIGWSKICVAIDVVFHNIFKCISKPSNYVV